jgi:hypothetical protein
MVKMMIIDKSISSRETMADSPYCGDGEKGSAANYDYFINHTLVAVPRLREIQLHSQSVSTIVLFVRP